MSFTVLVPARLASTRLPRKPLADIAGLPMIVRVARRAAQSSATSVVVAADHPDIVAACEMHGVRVVPTRSDHATGSDRLAEACALLGLDGDDAVVNVQGDEPLIDPGLIDACAALLDSRRDCVMSTAAHALHLPQEFDNPNVVKVVVSSAGFALYFSRRTIPYLRDQTGRPAAEQLAAFPFRKHLGIYGFRRDTLLRIVGFPVSSLEAAEKLEQLRALENGIPIAVATVDYESIGVDVPADVARVEARLAAIER